MGFERVAIFASFASQLWGLVLYTIFLLNNLTNNLPGFDNLSFTGMFVVTFMLILFTWLIARRSLVIMIDLASGIPRDLDRVREEGEYRFLLRTLTLLFAINVVLVALNALRLLRTPRT